MQEQHYSAKVVSSKLLQDIKSALKSVKTHGSVELFIQDGVVTQITVRSITKTSNSPKRK